MHGSSFFAAGLVLLCATAAAQQQIPVSRLQPITASPKRVTVDYVTGKRIRADAQVLAATTQTIYNNTCTWQTAAYFQGLANCEEIYDEGRIPSTSPGLGSIVEWGAFTFAYCTRNAASFSCEIAFADNAGGFCAGLAAQTPPTWASSTVYTEINLTPLGLPGSTANNVLACWIVGVTNLGLCVQADGDGVFNGNPATDLFTWGFHHNMPQQSAGLDGPFLSGDPNVAASGSCTYNIPCGSDPFLGGPCGTGLGTEDGMWINADGTPIGVSVPTNCPGGIAQFGYGTNCYWFGGWPTNPLASLYFQMEGGRSCVGCVPGVNYCTVNPSLDGCLPLMGAIGCPSINNPAGYTITTVSAPGQKNGIQFFGLNGPNNTPFSNGTLCVTAPLIRLPVTNTGGTGGACDGNLSYSFTVVLAQAANFGTPISAGSTVHQQAWIRDPGSAASSAVSNGRTYTVFP